MALALSEFAIEQVAFEVRFAEAFQLWDRSGRLALNATPFRGKLVTGEPGKIAFRKDRLEAVFELTQARVILHHPTTLDAFPEHAHQLVSLVTSVLEVPAFTRIGMRTIAFRKTDSIEAAASKLVGTNLLRLPPGRSFDAEEGGAPTLAEYGVRLQGRARATTLRLRTDERKLEIEPPAAIKSVETKIEQSFGLVLDVDQFTLAQMDAPQLVAREWVKGAVHLYRRDAGNFLAGAPG